MHPLAHLACAGVLLAPAAPPTSRTPRACEELADEQQEIDAAIARGLAHLSELYAGDERATAPTASRAPSLLDHPGLFGLALYTLVRCGAEPASPAVESLVARLALERIERTYDAACVTLALVALDPVRYRSWIDELTANLVAWQEHAGDWGYPDGGDLSNTQFAALALRAAGAAGIELPPDLWSRLARGVLLYRTADGGFGYAKRGREPTGSMTTAGISTLAICELELARAGALSPELASTLRTARERAFDWLAEDFSVEHSPRQPAWTHYYLWGLERACALSGVRFVGEHDWYAEGARSLVASQAGDGSWAGTFERAPTLFALLFLRRATHTPSPVTGIASRPEPAAAAVSAAARIGVTVDDELHLWIAGWPRRTASELEWPGEEGRGPRVVRVEYLVDDEPFAVSLGDARRPADGHDFAVARRPRTSGPASVKARVHVLAPPRDGPARPVVIESDTERIALAPEAVVRRAAISARETGDGAPPPRAKTKASSALRSGERIPPQGCDGRFAVDGNPRSPWIAAADDDTPRLRVTLRKPVLARGIALVPAHLLPRSPEGLVCPKRISLRTGRGKPVVWDLPHDLQRRTELLFDAPRKLKTLDLRILERWGEGTLVGLGEVEVLPVE